MENEHEALAALSAVDAGRAAAADRLTTPWWYHPALGLLISGLFIAVALGPLPVRVGAIAFFALGIGLLVSAYRQMTGVWISGFSAGKASGWTVALTAVLVVALVGGLALHHQLGAAWPIWAGAIVAFAAVIVFGRLFDDAVRARLRAGTSPARP